jgi:tetratricopeptide (TPR) repeat protein
MQLKKNLIENRMLFQINQHIEQNRINEAIEELVTLIESFQDFAPAYNVLGFLYANAFGDPHQAILCYDKALSIDPEYAPTYFNILVALNATGGFDRIPGLAKEALEKRGIDPGKIYFCLGMMHELRQQFDHARQQYQIAVRNSVLDNEIIQYRKAIERCDLKHSFVPR